MAEWWIIEKATGKVLNVLTTSRPGPPDLSVFRNSDRLEATMYPSQEQREGYRWWDQQP